MSTMLTTKPDPKSSPGHKPGMVVVFYLLTFLTGGFFLFIGDKLGFIVDLTAAVFYIVVAILFYAQSKKAQEPTVT